MINLQKITSKLKSLAYVCFCLLLILGCTLQKRSYRSGYYISWNKNKEKTERKNNVAALKKIDLHLNNGPFVTKEVIASIKTAAPAPLYTSIKNILGGCDTILFQNGKIVQAKVLEINTNEIKYRDCTNPEAPTIITNKNDVATIIYANGTVEKFDQKPVVTTFLTNTSQTVYVKNNSWKKKGKSFSDAFYTWLIILAICIIAVVALIIVMLQPGNSSEASGPGCILAVGIALATICGIIALIGTIASAIAS